MEDFGKFMREGGFTDLVIQMALVNIDSGPLATALVDQDEEVRSMVFRNMSTRAVSFLMDDIRARSAAPPEALSAAQGHFAALLSEAKAAAPPGGGPPAEPLPPAIDLSSREAIITTFCALAEFVRGAGFLPLEAAQATIGNRLFAKGLLMLIEGWDPLLVRSILEKYKEARLRALETEMELLIEGIDSLAARDSSTVTEMRLRAIVAGL